MVYYHLDKWPRLFDFHKFLCKLEELFEVVSPEWTPMVPAPDGVGVVLGTKTSGSAGAESSSSSSSSSSKNNEADESSSLGVDPYPFWRSVVSDPGNPASKGGYNPLLEGKTENIGRAGSKKDLCTYCRGIKVASTSK